MAASDELPASPSQGWELLNEAARLVQEIDQRPGNLKDFPREFVWPLAIQAVGFTWQTAVIYDAIGQLRAGSNHEQEADAGEGVRPADRPMGDGRDGRVGRRHNRSRARP